MGNSMKNTFTDVGVSSTKTLIYDIENVSYWNEGGQVILILFSLFSFFFVYVLFLYLHSPLPY